MIRNFFWQTEDPFGRLKPLLPIDTQGKPRVNDRRVISGIVHVLKSGGRWIDAPDVYGPRKTPLQSFCPLVGERRMGRHLPCARLGGRTSRASSDR